MDIDDLDLTEMADEEYAFREKQREKAEKKQREKEMVKKEAKWLSYFSKFSKRIEVDLQKIPFKEAPIESAYIYGKIGSGKTINAIFRILSYIKECIYSEKEQFWESSFITVPELLLKFKQSYTIQKTKPNDDEKDEKGPLTEYQLLEYYSNVDFLVLDDFGVERTTDWSFQLLYILINRRYENMKITVITSNYSLEALAEKLGDERITSRIQQMCKIYQTSDKNYRE
jgi:DNA replication protein DnaC